MASGGQFVVAPDRRGRRRRLRHPIRATSGLSDCRGRLGPGGGARVSACQCLAGDGLVRGRKVRQGPTRRCQADCNHRDLRRCQEIFRDGRRVDGRADRWIDDSCTTCAAKPAASSAIGSGLLLRPWPGAGPRSMGSSTFVRSPARASRAISCAFSYARRQIIRSALVVLTSRSRLPGANPVAELLNFERPRPLVRTATSAGHTIQLQSRPGVANRRRAESFLWSSDANPMIRQPLRPRFRTSSPSACTAHPKIDHARPGQR